MKEQAPETGDHFKAVIAAPSLKAVLRSISTIYDEATLVISPEGITTLVADPAWASMIDVVLDKSAFMEFAADHFKIRVDIDKLSQILMVTDNLDIVLLERSSDEKSLVISFGYFKYELQLLESLRRLQVKSMPTIPNTTSVSIPGREFVRMVAAAEAVSDQARVGVGVGVDGEFFMEAVGVGGIPERTNKMSIIIPMSGTEVKRSASLYSIEYLQALAEAVNYDEAVCLEIATDRPLLATFEACSGCKIRYMLAPRIESD